jgi:hypothetical protein
MPHLLRPSGSHCPARLAVVMPALITMIAATGCSLTRPEARATDMRISTVAGDVAQVEVLLELRNAGKDEIELVEYDYVVSLADGTRYGGRWAALRALPPGQTVQAVIPAVLPLQSLRDGKTAWSMSGTLRYRDPESFARILYEAGILKSQVDMSGSGPAIATNTATGK